MNQLVISTPKDVSLRTSNVKRQQLTSTKPTRGVSVELKCSIARSVQFVDARKEYEPCSEFSCGDKTLSGEPRDRILSGVSGNIKNKPEGDCVDSICSIDDSKS